MRESTGPALAARFICLLNGIKEKASQRLSEAPSELEIEMLNTVKTKKKLE
jgi:hypothetical protein